MAIIPTLPITLQNGTLADATQVMADFNAIVTAVNTNAANSGVNTNITALTGLTTPLPVIEGGTGAAIGPQALINLGAAASGANSDITSLSGLTTPLAVSEGGTGANAASAIAANNIGAAELGANSSITSLTGLTTPLPVNEGGTGASMAAIARINLGAVATKDASVIRAWAQIAADGTITSSFNVATVNHPSAGHYTLNFSTALGNPNYAVIQTIDGNSSPGNITNLIFAGGAQSRTVNSVDVTVLNGVNGGINHAFSVVVLGYSAP